MGSTNMLFFFVSESKWPDEPLSSEEKSFYQECKQYYHITGKPLISTSDEIFIDNIELTSASLKFGIDEDYNTFNVQEFLNKICSILSINTNDIQITKLQNGSSILEILIDGKKVNIKLTLNKIYKSLTEKVQEELAKLKVFFMFMGNIKALNDKQKFRSEIKLHPQWNRVYDVGHIHWTGALQDGRDRGKYAYFCPIGWKRHAFDVSDNYDEKFKGWSICYHGTKFDYGLSILLSGLAPARIAALGKGIYASQSIIYSTHPRYAEIKRIQSSDEKTFFKNGKYVQFVLQCRVHPNNIIVVGPETLGVDGKGTIDPNLTNNVIEWVIDAKNKDLMDFSDPSSTIVCTGLMIRVTDNHPGLLTESQWWYSGHICNNKNCCCLGIDLSELMKQKNNGVKCNFIYE
ncbi:unnamed protein product [Rotaria sp. Silwood2]|nr:unnamed protein product [Rotaria sp. Silwood2]